MAHNIQTRWSSVASSLNVEYLRRAQLWENLIKWQSPPDPSINHNIACNRQHEGTAEWFFRGGIFERWKGTGSLLWIHGKPGSGKSVLCSAIIEDIIATLYKAGRASMAYFYFDFRDADKQSRRNLLPSLLIQLSAHSGRRFNILSRLYEAHDNGARQPNDNALTHCLKEMLTLPHQDPIYLILDGLDECPNSSETPSIPSSRRRVLDLVKEIFGLRLQNLHICMTSRPEVDIRDVIAPLAFHQISIHDERGQKADIATYVRSVVYSAADTGAAMRRWREEEKELAVKTLSDEADGMFRWVYCQLEVLQNCLPNLVRQKLKELPKTLDETYERILKEIRKADGDLAFRILQCLSVASRPLRVEELAEVLALDFEEAEGRIPKFTQNWRLQDRQQALLITCSSLITIVKDRHIQVVQFSHFSVREFLTSDRLATPVREISSFRILPKPAHTILAQACMAALLRLDDSVSTDTVQSSFPLAKYAAEHWVDHAQFENVSLRIEDGMQRLFDQSGPYFTAWLELHDIDTGGSLDPDTYPAPPLYYASLCGFRDLAERLLIKSPQDVHSTAGRHHSPLAAALRNRHFHVAKILCQHGADIELAGYKNRTLLVGGHVDAVQWLLDEHDANVNLQQSGSRTSSLDIVGGRLRTSLRRVREFVDAVFDSGDSPLHLASAHGRFETMQLLIEHGADTTARNNSNSTPLHQASRWGRAESMQFLIQNGADVNARDNRNSTPLNLVLTDDDYIVRDTTAEAATEVLVQNGADVNARDKRKSTPLHLALSFRVGVKSVPLLIQHGADVNARDKRNLTPIYLALSEGYADSETLQLLLQHGADINARIKRYWTPLHLALSKYHDFETMGLLRRPVVDVVYVGQWVKRNPTPLHLALSEGNADSETLQLLLQHGADVNARDKKNSTPLHIASSQTAEVEFLRPLLQRGADVNARDKTNSTPLHLVLSEGYADSKTLQLLLQHGAHVNARDKTNSTPLHLALSKGHADSETLQLLLQHGADVNARDKTNSTPLHIASSKARAEFVQLLLQYGVDAKARDKDNSTPLHVLASSVGSRRWSGLVSPVFFQAAVGSAQLLLQHGADVNARDKGNSTPLHLAPGVEFLQLLLQHGADVNARDKRNSTPLHLVSSREGVESVRLLIQHGADVHARDKSNSTPLHLASSLGNADSLQLLLQHGADVHARDKNNATPLHLASTHGNVELLIQHGADVHARDKRNSTPLHLASFRNNADSLRSLLQHGADVRTRDKNNATPLHLASSRGNANSLQSLLEHGADVHARDKNNATPLYLAFSQRSTRSMRLLIQYGADVNARDKNNATLLHLALSQEHADSIELLIQNGADVNARDKRNSTPLHLVPSLRLNGTRRMEIARLLLEHGANADAKDNKGRTPYEIALSASGRASHKIARLISDHRNRTRETIVRG